MNPADDQAAIPRHFDGKRFFNPGAPSARGLPEALHWMLTRRREPSAPFVADVDPSIPPPSIEGDELRVTFVNHSTVLLQQKGFHILTDPIWAEHAGPWGAIGPRRHRMPGVRMEHLPRIDLVLISHDHYDHLDIGTLRRLQQCGEPEIVVPTGIPRLLRSERIGPVHELDWGESLALPEATIHCVPARHFSGRGLFDRDSTLWCGYTVESRGRIIYFAGDTAFGDHFAAIRQRFGPPRLALLPIGSYEPRWFMAAVHMDPEEAVKAHQILSAGTSIAIHHGTFQLGDDGIDSPKRRLAACFPGESFLALNNGQFVTLA